MAAPIASPAQPGATATAPTGSAPILQIHSAGLGKIEAGAKATTLKSVLALPESQELISTILDKLATVPYRLSKTNLPSGTTDRTDLIRPLLDDCAREESWMGWRGSDRISQWALAVHLKADQQSRWSTNLWQLSTHWGLGTPTGVKTAGLGGWQSPPKNGFSAIQFLRHNDWVLVLCADAAAPWIESLRTTLGQESRPAPELKDKFLDLAMDTPALGKYFPVLKTLGLPPMQCSIQGDGEYVRTKAQWNLAAPLNLNLRPWNIPTNSIHNPNNSLVSFSVARGIEPLLKAIKADQLFGKQPLPDQASAWGQSQFFVGQTLIAFPVSDPTNTVLALNDKVPGWSSNMLGNLTGTVSVTSNRWEVVWRGLPLLIPFAKPVTDHNQSFLLSGLAPTAGPTNPAPAEMFTGLTDKPKLLYYDWEITGQRYLHNAQFFQLALVLAKRKTQATNAVTFRWGQKINTLLGNSITELTQTSPTQFDLVRKSHIGLTGAELLAFCRWIDSPEFPFAISMPDTLANMLKNRLKPPEKDTRPKKTP